VGLEPVALLCEPDGTFPVHHPDPSMPENVELLRRTVLEQGLDLGIAYDGDGDRIGVIDDRGELLFGDRLLILLGRALLAERPGAAILGEVKCSQTLYDDIAARGGRPILWKTGHSLIKKKMKEEGALLAGEMSGHVFFGDRFYGFDDAVYATLRLLEILARTDRPLHALLEDVPRTFSTPEIRVECADALKFELVERVKERFARDHDVITVDGARVLFDGGWGLVRASNTQPVLVLRFEAESEARLGAIRAEVERAIEEASV
jgi:phosphomannomutase/phosphoglucomutase